MINYDAFLSRAGVQMQGSAIRKMGVVLAQNRDIISFAPGYPAPETFPWSDFQAITRELLSGADGAVLQYGPTRGYPPLLEQIVTIMKARGVASAIDRLLITTGSQQGLDLVARVLLDPGDVVLVELPTYTGAITAFRNVQAQMEGVPQDVGRHRPGGTRRDLRPAHHCGPSRAVPLCRPELPESDRPADQPRQAPGPARMGQPPQRA